MRPAVDAAAPAGVFERPRVDAPGEFQHPGSRLLRPPLNRPRTDEATRLEPRVAPPPRPVVPPSQRTEPRVPLAPRVPVEPPPTRVEPRVPIERPPVREPVPEAPAEAPTPTRVVPRRSPGPARRRVVRINAPSVFRAALAFYLGILIALVVGGTVLWFLLQLTGVVGNIESFVGELLGYEDFHFLFGRILLGGTLLGLVWVVVSAVVTALLAALYNRVSGVVGGVVVVVDEERPEGRGPDA